MNRYTNRSLWQITYPILLSLLMESLLGITDTAFLGHVGEVELGASALAGVYFMTVFMLIFGFSIGIQILIARRNGEGQHRAIGRLFQQGVVVLAVFATVMFVVSKLFTPQLLRQLISSENIYQATLDYLNWRIYGFFFASGAILFRAFYVGVTQTRMLTANSLLMVLSNVLFNYLLIFGHCGFPALGIQGAAIASAAAELTSLLYFAIYTRLHRSNRHYGLFRIKGFSFQGLSAVFHVSIWTMLQAFVSTGSWFLFFLAIEHLGEQELAISNILRSISSVMFVVASAFASTTSAVVSTLMGQGAPQKVLPVSYRIIRLCYLIVLPIMGLLFLFPETALRLYTNDPQIIASALSPMRVMIAIYFTLIPGNILFSTVSGTGNTRAAMLMELIALIVYVIAIWYLILYLRVPLAACWTVDHIYCVVLLLFTYLYLRKANWQHTKI